MIGWVLLTLLVALACIWLMIVVHAIAILIGLMTKPVKWIRLMWRQ